MKLSNPTENRASSPLPTALFVDDDNIDSVVIPPAKKQERSIVRGRKKDDTNNRADIISLSDASRVPEKKVTKGTKKTYLAVSTTGPKQLENAATKQTKKRRLK